MRPMMQTRKSFLFCGGVLDISNKNVSETGFFFFFCIIFSLFQSSLSKSRKQEVWCRKPIPPEVRMVLDVCSWAPVLCVVHRLWRLKLSGKSPKEPAGYRWERLFKGIPVSSWLKNDWEIVRHLSSNLTFSLFFFFIGADESKQMCNVNVADDLYTSHS